MINCAIYQACLPGKSDKRNIYPQSSASKPTVMDEQRTECNINLPDTAILGPESTTKFPFCLSFQTNLKWYIFVISLSPQCFAIQILIQSHENIPKTTHLRMKMSYDHYVFKNSDKPQQHKQFSLLRKTFDTLSKKVARDRF